MNDLEWLQNWYASRCDIDGTSESSRENWQEQYGIKIDTLDNPGWTVDIDLAGTPWMKKRFKIVKMDISEHDWWFLTKDRYVFKIRCGPKNLTKTISIFREWIESTES